MAETQTAVNACNVVILLDNASDVPTDISGSSNTASISMSKETGEYRVFGGNWVKRLDCKKDATISLQVIYTTAANEGLDLLRDWWFTGSGTRGVWICIPDDSAGSDRYSAECLLTSLDLPVDASEAGPIMVSCELVPRDNGVSYEAIAT